MNTILTFGAGGMSAPFDGVKVDRSECDVRNIVQVVETLDAYNPTTVIVTAGVSHPDVIENASFEEEITTNLLGSFNVAQACVWHGVETMIFIASVAGLYGKPGHAGYSASKAGVISLVQSLAMEGHAAYAISPGRVDTPMRQRDYSNDTRGSRLDPSHIWSVVQDILHGRYEPGDNVIIRKIGLTEIVKQVAPVPWKEQLKVGQPLTI